MVYLSTHSSSLHADCLISIPVIIGIFVTSRIVRLFSPSSAPHSVSDAANTMGDRTDGRTDRAWMDTAYSSFISSVMFIGSRVIDGKECMYQKDLSDQSSISK